MKLRFTLILTLMLLTLGMSAAGSVDYTDYIENAACSEARCWNITSVPNNCLLQLDTWSSRGGKDGSDMTTPFYEYFIEKGTGYLADATISHDLIEGLPEGLYTLTVHTRVYDEQGIDYPNDAIHLVVNGVKKSIIDGAEDIEYNGQLAYNNVVSVQFTVGDDGKLSIAFEVEGAEFNWFSFKDVTLTYEGKNNGNVGGDIGNQPSDSPLESGTYYIRHAASGKWLNQGCKYDTGSALSDVPQEYEVTVNEEIGAIRILNPMTEQDLTQIGDDIWNDQWGTDWYPVEKGSNRQYSIVAEDGRYMMAKTTDEMANEVIVGDEEDVWQFYTKENLLAELSSATEQNPKDATFLIFNPGMKRNSNGRGWEGGPVLGGHDSEDLMSNYCAERWYCDFDIYQELEDIPNGKYQLSVQGFYRYGGFNAAAASKNNDQEELYAELYANDSSVPLMSIFDKDPETRYAWSDVYTSYGWVPDRMDGAALAFSYGEYNNNTLNVTVKGKSLTIGVRKSQTRSEDWTIFDNFRLTYLGPTEDSGEEEEDDQMKELLAATKDNPKDATYLIKKMSGNESYSTFKRKQTVTGLPNGLYRATIQGFYRYGRYDTEGYYSYGDAENEVWATYTQAFAVVNRKNGTEILFPKFYANEQQTGLMSVFEHAHEDWTHDGDFETELGWVPNNSTSAKQAFDDGEYVNELWVYVTNGTLELGIDKQGGYKHDWTYWANPTLTYYGAEDMVYANSISTDSETINIAIGETRQINAGVIPANASVQTLSYKSASTGIATVTTDGMLTGKIYGTTKVTITSNAGNGKNVTKDITINVSSANGDRRKLVINEIQPANIDLFIDPSKNYGGWIELYNPTSQAINLSNCYVTDEEANPWKFYLAGGVVPAHGFCNVWFDHNSAKSSQVNFKLNPEGGMIAICYDGSIVDKKEYPAIAPRVSYARTTDGGANWQITSTPTPASSNAQSKDFVAVEAERLPMPVATSETQLFESSVTVNVEIPDGATLLYTTDGTAPMQANGKQSNGTFSFDKSTTLRLRFYKNGMIASPVATYSYIKRDKDYTLPVLSVVSNPDNFYNDEIGVFTVGTAGKSGSGQDLACNWNMEWERPVNMEYISADGKRLISQECDLERCGGWSRSWYPYSFKLKGSKQYEGMSTIDYQFFPEDKPYNKHKALQIRNGGNDLLCRVKDASINQIVLTSGLYVDAISYQPSHVFVNGVYQGMMNIREPNNKHFSYSNYDIDPDSVDAFEFHWSYDVKAGTADAFREVRDLCRYASDKDTYAEIRKRLDIDEFINYMAVQLFLGGDDWPGNNCKGFIDQNDGKLHIVLFDLDQALRYNEKSLSRVAYGISNPIPNMWYNLMKNDEFKQQFIAAYSIVACSVFDPDRSHEIINGVAERLEYPLSLEGLDPWDNVYESIGILTEDRRDLMMRALSNYSIFGVYGKTAQNALISKDIDGGTILLNGQPIVTGKYDGPIYSPTTLSAKAPMGYTFAGWKNAKGTIISKAPNYSIPSTGNIILTASFKPELAGKAQIVVNEVSASNTVNANSDYFKKDDWIELYNPTSEEIDIAGMYLTDDAAEPQKYHIPSNDTQETIIPANGHLVVWASKRTAKGKDLHANFKLGNNDGELVMLTSEDGTWCDTLRYAAHGGKESVGRFPDGGKDVYHFLTPTVSKQNTLTSYSDFLYTYIYNGIEHMDPVFTLDLAEGWNWISHPMQSNIAVADISNGALSVLGQRSSTMLDPVLGWTGTLQTLNPITGYKVQMQTSKNYTFRGDMQDEHSSIALHQGWNWVGYPFIGSQPLAQALSAFAAAEGDVIVGQSGFSTFENGKWSGTLTTLRGGNGYLYKSARPNSIRYTNGNAAAEAHARFVAQPRTAWSANATAYPNVMGMVATIIADGMEAPEGAYSVGAFSEDGECRGTGTYAEGKLWMTIYGNGGEALTFKAADASTGIVYDMNENAVFASDVIGSRKMPTILTIGDATGIASIRNSQALKSVGYYHIDGTYAGSSKGALRTGTYIQKFEMRDGSTIVNKISVK